MRILIGINILNSVKAQAYISHMNAIFRWGRQYPDDQFMLYTPERMSIDRMRNTCAKIALESNCDYLMFVDDDVIIEPGVLKSLLDADKDIVAAETYIRGYPYPPMFFKFGPERKSSYYYEFKDHVGPDGLVECDAVGFSCVLIKCELLRKLVPPYFVTGEGFTEDVFFCIKAKAQLPETTIYTDTKQPTGHILTSEAIHPVNRDALRRLHEEQMKAIDPEWDPDDISVSWRGKKELEAFKEAFNEA